MTKAEKEYKDAVEQYKKINEDDDRFNFIWTMVRILFFFTVVLSMAIAVGLYISLFTFSSL